MLQHLKEIKAKWEISSEKWVATGGGNEEDFCLLFNSSWEPGGQSKKSNKKSSLLLPLVSSCFWEEVSHQAFKKVMQCKCAAVVYIKNVFHFLRLYTELMQCLICQYPEVALFLSHFTILTIYRKACFWFVSCDCTYWKWPKIQWSYQQTKK